MLQRSSCHLVPFGQGEVTSPVCGDQDHPQGFQGWVAMPWSGNWTCVLSLDPQDPELFHREDNQAVRQAVQSPSLKVFKT